MKNVFFSVAFLIGFCFSFSEISAQSASVIGMNLVGSGNYCDKDQIVEGVKIKLPVLYQELNQLPPSSAGAKYKNIETLLYKGMLSSISQGRSPKESYEENFGKFLIEYPDENFSQKRAIAIQFNALVFCN